MRRFSIIVFLFAGMTAAWANDGVFFVNGNHLVPVQETDIELNREVLTISLCDDGYAMVDVQYVLTNRGKDKTVTMGFEAVAPYNDDVPFSPQGIHPYINDFTVVMNGQKLAYMNAVVPSKYNVDCDFQPLNLQQWKSYGEVKMRDGEDLPDNSMLYDASQDSLVGFAYAYYFIARFYPGKNTIHHTYRYRLGYGVGRTFEVPYSLMPAMRWANRQIDDFTLRIKATNTAKHFFVEDSLFAQEQFVVKEGLGKIRKTKWYNELFTEIALRNGTVEWHALNYKPKGNMNIQSAERLHYDDFKLGTFYDRSDNYLPGTFMIDPKKSRERQRILSNLPYASRGYVFKDKKLKKYFSQFWWYMPDPQWQPDTSDFTAREWKLINEGE
ncbi:MAG: YARHG domain-containing protein [Bacteroidaceae bacterium]|nr:YARHG domain-containing protein [Bacteroidaceae bacterium]